MESGEDSAINDFHNSKPPRAPAMFARYSLGYNDGSSREFAVSPFPNDGETVAAEPGEFLGDDQITYNS